MKEHIVTTYDEDLNSLKSNLTKMGLNVEKQIYNAVAVSYTHLTLPTNREV